MQTLLRTIAAASVFAVIACHQADNSNEFAIAKCELDEFPDGAGVCRKCSWCNGDAAAAGADPDLLLQLHQRDICSRFAGSCAQLTQRPTEPRSHLQEEQRTTTVPARDSSTSVAGNQTVSNLTTRVVVVVQPPVVLPPWAWALVAAFVCVLLVSIPGWLVWRQRFHGGQEKVETDEPGDPTIVPLTVASAAASTNLRGSQGSIYMTQEVQQERLADRNPDRLMAVDEDSEEAVE